jgi:photosystem II stability/assembly factor-like uncharacterized protein
MGETTNGGTSWRLFPQYQPTSGWHEAATVVAIGPTAYLHISPVGVYYTGNGGSTWQPVSYTSDGGATWTLMSTGYSMYGENGVQTPDGTLYIGLSAGNGAGVFYSKANGTNPLGGPNNWTVIPNSPQSAITFTDGTYLYAGRGSFDTSGQPYFVAPLSNISNWTQSTSATDPSAPVQGPYEYAYDAADHIMYSGNYSGGVLRLVVQ